MTPTVPHCPHTDFCNKIGTNRTNRDVRSTVAIEGKADMARTSLGFRRHRSSWPFADNEQYGILGFGAVEMHLLSVMGHKSARRHRHRGIGIEFGAGADPPCSLEHGDEAVVRMELRAAEMIPESHLAITT